METRPPPDVYGFTEFCDDVRQEVGGKFSYIGVYGGNMFIHGPFPITLGKFCLAITLMQLREGFEPNIGLKIFLPGDSEDAPSIDAEFQETKEGAIAEQTAAQAAGLPKPDFSFVAMNTKLIFSPFTINQPGDMRVRAVRRGELIRLGGLRIIAAPVEQPTP
ncbi:MAG TPA: hypothetical protein VGG01_12310 [Xanthobacteraceae bacterium]|jgi:hypothetical protein